MQVGVMFPQNEIGADVEDIRAFVRAAVECGCRHIWATDHVVGVDPARRPDWTGVYAVQHQFHEPLMLFAFVAAICDLELVTGVIVLPQRQTVLVAKQAAELDLLCRGRLRLGVGIGWNAAEYQALGMDFSTRGRRIEEQIQLLRRLWCEPSVDFEGEIEQLRAVGIAPRPIQRPIPIWMGAGQSPVSLRRVGRLADGYLGNAAPGPGSKVEWQLEMVRAGAREAGRDPASIGVQGLLPVAGKSPPEIRETALRWRELGASHLTIDPRSVSLHVGGDFSMIEKLGRQSSTQELIAELSRAAEIVAGLGLASHS